MMILVTGGAGFIGSNFIARVLAMEPDCRILCLDKLTYAASGNTAAWLAGLPQVLFVRGDICSRETVYRLFEKERPDYVVHFAAESHVDRSIETPELFLQTNISGTAVLLDACRSYGIRRFHLVSTDEVYGDLPLEEESLSFSEEAPLRPSSPYSSSKAAADLLALAYCRTYGLDITISRCTNNYGPFQHPEKLIPRMIRNAENRLPLPVYGSGANVRDWIYVEDHCAAVLRILLHGRAGSVYNVSAGNALRNIDVVERICDILGADRGLIRFVPDRKGHDLRYAIDSSKLRRELGWEPKTSFAAGLEPTVRWYQAHRDWWE